MGKTATVELLLRAGANKQAKNNVSVREIGSHACTCDKRGNLPGLWWGEDLLGGLPFFTPPIFILLFTCASSACTHEFFFFHRVEYCQLFSGLELDIFLISSQWACCPLREGATHIFVVANAVVYLKVCSTNILSPGYIL